MKRLGIKDKIKRKHIKNELLTNKAICTISPSILL